jgi:hypothetical protein
MGDGTRAEILYGQAIKTAIRAGDLAYDWAVPSTLKNRAAAYQAAFEETLRKELYEAGLMCPQCDTYTSNGRCPRCEGV